MSRKVVHMQDYIENGYYTMSTFCNVSVNCSYFDVNVTTQWDKCTCKRCLKYKDKAGLPN